MLPSTTKPVFEQEITALELLFLKIQLLLLVPVTVLPDTLQEFCVPEFGFVGVVGVGFAGVVGVGFVGLVGTGESGVLLLLPLLSLSPPQALSANAEPNTKTLKNLFMY